MILLVQISCILGLAISLYFTAIYKGLIKGIPFLVPKKICRKNTCSEVLRTGFAHVFGPPNFVLGIFYYMLIFGTTLYALPYWGYYVMLVLTWFVVLLSVYLAHALIFRLKIPCTLCFVSHVLNLIIAVYFLLL